MYKTFFSEMHWKKYSIEKLEKDQILKVFGAPRRAHRCHEVENLDFSLGHKLEMQKLELYNLLQASMSHFLDYYNKCNNVVLFCFACSDR